MRRRSVHCGANHHEFSLTPNLIEASDRVVWHADEPFAISSGFALSFLAKVARPSGSKSLERRWRR